MAALEDSDDTIAGASQDPYAAQPFLRDQLHAGATASADKTKGGARALKKRATDLPIDVTDTLKVIKPSIGRFHGAKFSLAYFPYGEVFSPHADKFGYLTSSAVRNATKLPIGDSTVALLTELGDLMGNAPETPAGDSKTPSGYTYVGQFVDHDITLDVSSPIDSPTEVNARVINNMRTPSLDLDSVYGKGPALDRFLYVFPEDEPKSAIRFQLGVNTPPPQGISPLGGPGGPTGASGMVVHTDFDVPRTAATIAIIGDPRNNENLIIAQLHHAMLRFHNAVVDKLVNDKFPGDIFVEAKRLVTGHYQWAVTHDFLVRVCGQDAVDSALLNVNAPIGGDFRMPVEFAVAAYRFGHSMVRDEYWLNFDLKFKPMSDVFAFVQANRRPVLSNWVVDFNAFFETGIPVPPPVFNFARKIDSALAPALEGLPGETGFMAVLASRNLLRGMVLGLPSGQGAARALGLPVMTEKELTKGLSKAEVAVLKKSDGLLLKKTPLWYYVLRESIVKEQGEHLGPLGAKIVADTFARMLKRSGESFLNTGFTPTLKGRTKGQFTFADLVNFAGVTG